MRSSTIFIVFGALLALVLLFSALSSLTVTKDPVMKSTKQFITAVSNRDARAAETLIDGSTGKVIQSAGKITGVRFSEVAPFEGVYAKRPAILWSVTDLAKLQVSPALTPFVDEETNLATVPTTMADKSAGNIYFRKVDGQWKIFYISKEESNTP
jgi:hypothetical protein